MGPRRGRARGAHSSHHRPLPSCLPQSTHPRVTPHNPGNALPNPCATVPTTRVTVTTSSVTVSRHSASLSLLSQPLFLLLLLAALVASPAASAAEYAPGSRVVELAPHSFQRRVLESPQWWLVVWYHPQCGHCRLLKGAFSAAASEAHSQGVPVSFGAISCREYPELAFEHRISYYPALMFYGANKSVAHEYEGWRSAEKIQEAAAAFAKSNGEYLPWGPLEYLMYSLKTVLLHAKEICVALMVLILAGGALVVYHNGCREVVRAMLHELGLPQDKILATSRGGPLLPLVGAKEGTGVGDKAKGCSCVASTGNCCALRRNPPVEHERDRT